VAASPSPLLRRCAAACCTAAVATRGYECEEVAAEHVLSLEGPPCIVMESKPAPAPRICHHRWQVGTHRSSMRSALCPHGLEPQSCLKVESLTPWAPRRASGVNKATGFLISMLDEQRQCPGHGTRGDKQLAHTSVTEVLWIPCGALTLYVASFTEYDTLDSQKPSGRSTGLPNPRLAAIRFLCSSCCPPSPAAGLRYEGPATHGRLAVASSVLHALSCICICPSMPC